MKPDWLSRRSWEMLWHFHVSVVYTIDTGELQRDGMAKAKAKND
jgi:hypothetical protein